jgi:hypothetical protein
VRGKGLKINIDNRCNPMAGYGRAQASVEQAQLVIRSEPGDGLEVSGDNWHYPVDEQGESQVSTQQI